MDFWNVIRALVCETLNERSGLPVYSVTAIDGRVTIFNYHAYAVIIRSNDSLVCGGYSNGQYHPNCTFDILDPDSIDRIGDHVERIMKHRRSDYA